LELHGSLNLGLEIIPTAERDIRLLHELEQSGLHAASTDISTADIRGRGNFVDFVDVDDAILRKRDVAISFLDEFANKKLIRTPA
jgi:hypothetical protein